MHNLPAARSEATVADCNLVFNNFLYYEGERFSLLSQSAKVNVIHTDFSEDFDLIGHIIVLIEFLNESDFGKSLLSCFFFFFNFFIVDW